MATCNQLVFEETRGTRPIRPQHLLGHYFVVTTSYPFCLQATKSLAMIRGSQTREVASDHDSSNTHRPRAMIMHYKKLAFLMSF
jgi:hypothetical protein